MKYIFLYINLNYYFDVTSTSELLLLLGIISMYKIYVMIKIKYLINLV